jgi:hypothetical protein
VYVVVACDKTLLTSSNISSVSSYIFRFDLNVDDKFLWSDVKLRVLEPKGSFMPGAIIGHMVLAKYYCYTNIVLFYSQ